MGKDKFEKDKEKVYDFFLELIDDNDPEEFSEKYARLLEDQYYIEALSTAPLSSISASERNKHRSTSIINNFLIGSMVGKINNLIEEEVLYLDEDGIIQLCKMDAPSECEDPSEGYR